MTGFIKSNFQHISFVNIRLVLFWGRLSMAITFLCIRARPSEEIGMRTNSVIQQLEGTLFCLLIQQFWETRILETMWLFQQILILLIRMYLTIVLCLENHRIYLSKARQRMKLRTIPTTFGGGNEKYEYIIYNLWQSWL